MEEQTTDQGKTPGGATGEPDKNPDEKPKETLYSQKEIERIIQGRLGKIKDENEKLKQQIGRLEELEQAEEQRKQAELAKKGEFEKSLDAHRQSYERQLKAERDKIGAVESKLRHVVVDAELLAAAGSVAVNEEAAKDIARRLKDRCIVEDAGDGMPHAVVVDDKGTPCYKDGGVPMTIKDLVESKREPWGYLFKAPDNTRTGSGGKKLPAVDSNGSTIAGHTPDFVGTGSSLEALLQTRLAASPGVAETIVRGSNTATRIGA